MAQKETSIVDNVFLVAIGLIMGMVIFYFIQKDKTNTQNAINPYSKIEATKQNPTPAVVEVAPKPDPRIDDLVKVVHQLSKDVDNLNKKSVQSVTPATQDNSVMAARLQEVLKEVRRIALENRNIQVPVIQNNVSKETLDQIEYYAKGAYNNSWVAEKKLEESHKSLQDQINQLKAKQVLVAPAFKVEPIEVVPLEASKPVSPPVSVVNPEPIKPKKIAKSSELQIKSDLPSDYVAPKKVYKVDELR